MMKINDAALRGRFYDELTSEHTSTTCDRIVIPAGYNGEVRRDVIENLKDSIRDVGVRSPIGVAVEVGKQPELIYGLHRLLAQRELFEEALANGDDESRDRFHSIPITKYRGEKISTESREYLHCIENAHRKELTTAERKKVAARIGELQSALRPKAKPRNSEKTRPAKKEKNANLFKEWYEAANVPNRTALDWFSDYREHADWPKSKKPASMSGAEMAAFLAWLDGRESEAKDKAHDAAIEKAHAKLKPLLEDFRATFGDVETRKLLDDCGYGDLLR